MNEQCFQKSYSQDVPRYDFQLAKYGAVHNSHELPRVGDEILPVCKMHGHRQVPACRATHRYAFFLDDLYWRLAGDVVRFSSAEPDLTPVRYHPRCGGPGFCASKSKVGKANCA